MAAKASVEAFVGQKTLALVGVSRSGKKFGNSVLKELTAKGYTVYPVHPAGGTIDGVRVYADFKALPETPGGVVVVVPPEQTTQVVRDAREAGITRVWMQQGAESAAAIDYCRDYGLDAVHGECILMFASPSAWHHKTHRWIKGVLGKLPR
jgi:uncharacterized protein